MKDFRDIVIRNLNTAIKILEHEKISSDKWRWGGGTVLYWLYEHRISKDIDIFLYDPQLLGFLTPRLNDWIEAMVQDYTEGPTFVKLKFTDFEIDFIVARDLTDFMPLKITVSSRIIYAEHPIEIISKKIFYKGFSLKIRDILDISVVYEKFPDLARVLGEKKLIPEPVEFLYKNLELLKKETNDQKLLNSISQTEKLLKEAYKIQTLRKVKKFDGL